jgi:hypothetical protein
MSEEEFRQRSTAKNILYKLVHGTEADPKDYVGTREEFLAALSAAVRTNQPIENFIKKRVPSSVSGSVH